MRPARGGALRPPGGTPTPVPLTMTGLRVNAVWDKRGPYARIKVLAY